MFDLPRRGFLGSLIAAVVGVFGGRTTLSADERRQFGQEWREASPTRFAWGQGLVNFEGCCELPTPGRIFIDGRESHEWIDFVDLTTLEYRLILRDPQGEAVFSGWDVIRIKAVAHSSITIIDADGTEWSSNHV